MKPFIIVMGETDVFIKYVTVNYTHKKVLDATKTQGWTLWATKNTIYWDIGDPVKNLTRQFMHYDNPSIYFIVNFKAQNYLSTLKNNYGMVRRAFIIPKNKGRGSIEPKKIIVIGFNYNSSIHLPMKKKVLEWCVANNNDLEIEYTDFDNFDKSTI